MSYRVRRYNSFEHNLVKNLLKGIWWVVSLPFRLIFGRKPQKLSVIQEGGIDKQFLQKKWQEIEELMSLGRPSNFARAVLEADKLLDHVLKGLRTPGLTMGDRLKASKNRFSPEGLDAAWKAHKVRNEIVHNSQYEITDFMAREAILNFKKAIEELVSF